MDTQTFVEGTTYLAYLVGAGFFGLLMMNVAIIWYLDKIRDELKAMKK
jgi:hypothetical protein